MKAMLRTVDDHGNVYPCLMFVCPGCKEFGGTGLHMLPVNTTNTSPAWSWDGNLEKPTLSPSILTGANSSVARCHSFLKAGVFEYLGDSTHSLANGSAELPDLPDWVVENKT